MEKYNQTSTSQVMFGFYFYAQFKSQEEKRGHMPSILFSSFLQGKGFKFGGGGGVKGKRKGGGL